MIAVNELSYYFDLSHFIRAVDVLGEDIIIKWYKEAHVTKGKSVFLQQMQKMVEWLQNAEEGEMFFSETTFLTAD